MTTDQIDDASPDGVPAGADDQADGAARADGETVTVPVAEYEALRREVAEWKERCVRGQAEFDNVRKRLRKEADESGTRAVVRFVRPLLDQLDNLERALAVAKPESFTEFAQGVSMIRENLLAALSNAGIEPIPAEGAFDPALHEAIAEEARADLPRGHITQVHRQGFRLKDQLVRTAQVVVSKPPADGG